jgi:hypothetical protein
MTNPLLERIIRETTGEDILVALSKRLTPTDLQSLLLEVFRLRSSQITPAELLADYERNPYVRPSALSPQTLIDFDQIAFSLAGPLFEPVELSSVISGIGTERVCKAMGDHG